MDVKKHLSEHKSLIESFFSLSILNGLNILLPLISLPYILRIIGPDRYGSYIYVYAIVQYIIVVCAYGFNYSGTRQIVQVREENSKVNEVFNGIIACRLFLGMVCVLLVLLLSPFLFSTKAEYLMFFMGIGCIIGDIFVPTWFFQGMEKMRYLTIVNVVAKLLFTILIFIFINKEEDYTLVMFLNSCGYLLSGILSVVFVVRKFKIRPTIPHFSVIKYQLKDGWALFASTIGINLYRESNVFIMKFFVSDAAVGIYGAADKIIKGLQLAVTPISQALFPHLGNSFKGRSHAECLEILKKVSKPFAALLIFLTAFSLIAANFLVDLLCGSEFYEATMLVRIMSPAIFIGGMNYLLGVVGLVNLNQKKNFLLAVMLAGVANVAFLLCTVGKWGNVAASFTVLLSEFIVFMTCLISLYKIKKSTTCSI